MGSDDATFEAAERALGEAAVGRFDGVDAALRGLRDREEPAARWWAYALQLDRYLAGLDRQCPSAPAEPLEGPAQRAASRRAGLVRLLELQGDHPAGDPWAAVCAGELSEPGDAGEVDPVDEAAVVVERTIRRALLALNEGALDDAATHARRASRMARTEGMPQSTYLANVVLARVRRLSGRPYLAARILRALARVAPPPWLPWLRWELTMAAGQAPRASAHVLPTLLQRALGAASAGDRPAFDAAFEALDAATRGVAFLERDVALARAALDPDHVSHLDDLAAFARGETDTVPRGIVGLAGRDELPTDVAVCVAKDGRSRRVLWTGVRLFREPTLPEGRPGRTETAIAVLAFAGRAGLHEAELFERAYLFGYQRELHRSVLGVLIHRARAWLGDSATLHREEGQVWLEPHEPLVVPDPRCDRETEERVLVFFGSSGLSTAKQAAEELGISVRSTQAALAALVEDGALERVRRGRSIAYALEDTTFEEPTRA